MKTYFYSVNFSNGMYKGYCFDAPNSWWSDERVRGWVADFERENNCRAIKIKLDWCE